MHDASLWEPTRVLPLLPIMQAWGYNALVLHQNDLLDVATQLGLSANYGVADLRLKKVRNNAAWLNHLVAELDAIGAKLFLEIKEPSFHDYAIELLPGLLGTDGQPDPTQPAWPDFCRRKTEDLLARVPGLGGLIVNLSSPESRLSVPDHMAQRDLQWQQEDWFDAMIAAFEDPLRAEGKALFIRDFSYTADMQSGVLAAVGRCNGRVGASIKITAHDYFPDFPQNPALAAFSGPKIAEFEAFGEHTGWGVLPNCRVAEFARRMRAALETGVQGILLRISWEAITGAQALDGLSAVNVYALARLMEGEQDPATLVRAWLCKTRGCDDASAKAAAELLLQSAAIPAAAYWNGQVFPRHSCLPSSWQEGWVSMDTSGMGRRDMTATIAPDDPRLSDEAGRELFAAKDAAVQLARELAHAASQLRPALSEDFASFNWLEPFAQQFDLAARATFHAARGSRADREALGPIVRELEDFADALESRLAEDPALPHHHRVLFDPNQVRRFAASLPN